MFEYDLEEAYFEGVMTPEHKLEVIVNPFETVMHERDVLEHDGMPYIDIREMDTGKAIWTGILGTLDIDSIEPLSVRQSLESVIDDAKVVFMGRLDEPIDIPRMSTSDPSVVPMSWHDLLEPGGIARMARLDLGTSFGYAVSEAMIEAQVWLRYNFDTCVYMATQVKQWYEFYHPGNPLAGDIREGLEFEDMIAALLKGKSFEVAVFEHATVGSTNLDIKQFLEAAKKYSLADYDTNAVDKIDALAAANARHVLDKEDFYRGVYCAADNSIVKVDLEKSVDRYYSDDEEPGLPVLGLYGAQMDEQIGIPVHEEQKAWGHTAREVDECLQSQNALFHLTDREASIIDAAQDAFMERLREPVVYKELPGYRHMPESDGITYLDLLTPEGMKAIPREALPDVMNELERRLHENENECAALLEQERGDQDLDEER